MSNDHNPALTIRNLRQRAQALDTTYKTRLHRPRLVPLQDVPKRSIHTAWGFAALVHSIAHIEFNAIQLALDAVWRFDSLPLKFYQDWMKVAQEERHHFALLEHLLQDLGYQYGDFLAHDGLWRMCETTRHDVIARMALVPRTLEARGLDATPIIQTRLQKITGAQAAIAQRFHQILDVILNDEIGHVAIGNTWYRWLCERHNLNPLVHYKYLAYQFHAPRLKPPINQIARLKAGFTTEELMAETENQIMRDAVISSRVLPHACLLDS